MKITRTSMISGITRTMDIPITEEQWELWDEGNGPLAQDCFPDLDIDSREFIISGITREEWDEVMGEADELFGSGTETPWDDEPPF